MLLKYDRLGFDSLVSQKVNLFRQIVFEYITDHAKISYTEVDIIPRVQHEEALANEYRNVSLI